MRGRCSLYHEFNEISTGKSSLQDVVKLGAGVVKEAEEPLVVVADVVFEYMVSVSS